MSIWEMLIILCVALIVFGPEQIPTLARALGKLFAHVRHMRDTFSQQLIEDEQQSALKRNHSKAERADKTYEEINLDSEP